MTYVLDASVVLAFIRAEAGAGKAETRMQGAFMSSVNFSEAIMRSVEKGFSDDVVSRLIVSEQIGVIDFDGDLARKTAALRPATKHVGLSFADRACIATAISLDATAVTADRTWTTLDLPCKIELIR